MPSQADIDARILNKLGNNSTFWTPEERVTAFNEALSVWQSMTGEWTGQVNLEPTGEVFQDVPRQVVSPQRVSYNGAQLELTSLEELDLGTPTWQERDSSGANLGFESWSPPIDTTGLLSWWDLEEATGTRVDSFGTNHLTPINTPTGNIGRVGYGNEFVLASQQSLRIASPSTGVALPGDFAITAWVWTNSLPGSGPGTNPMVIIDRNRNYDIDIGNFGSPVGVNPFRFFTTDSSGIATSVTANVKPEIGRWYFVYADHDNTTFTNRISINAGTFESASGAGPPDHAVSSTFEIGNRFSGPRWWNGKIDTVTMWNRKLTDSEISILYNAGLGRSLQDAPAEWNSYGSSVAQSSQRTSGSLGAKLTKGTFPSGVGQDFDVTSNAPILIEVWAASDATGGGNTPAGHTLRVIYDSSTQTIVKDFTVGTTFAKYLVPITPSTETSATIIFQAGAEIGDPFTVIHLDDVFIYAGETPLYWAPVGLNKILLYPVPVGGLVTIEGLVDAPYAPQWPYLLGDDKLDTLIGYAHHVLSFKEAGVEFQSTQPAMTRLIQEASSRNAEIRATAFYRKYMGEIRDDRERPRKTGQPSLGARG